MLSKELTQPGIFQLNTAAKVQVNHLCYYFIYLFYLFLFIILFIIYFNQLFL